MHSMSLFEWVTGSRVTVNGLLCLVLQAVINYNENKAIEDSRLRPGLHSRNDSNSTASAVRSLFTMMNAYTAGGLWRRMRLNNDGKNRSALH